MRTETVKPDEVLEWTKADLESVRDRKIDEFCSSINKLMACVVSNYKRDVDVISLRDLLREATSSIPEIIVQRAGALLYSYREEIEGERFGELMSKSFDEEIKEATEQEQAKACRDMIQRIQKMWATLRATERNGITKLVEGMLKSYKTYAVACKKISTY